ncbi:flagellar biosynthetic protein FliR [Pullulanibacillus sp. KACC 23026]|uniref:flagellar biosynthetic protein FliR n=1 Tax=Pullulanibacillus sp. KACC 23026 TaxID=3028315 RepID=UPI0023AFF85E|nr:flagellar biosynthetic protein FliR [Pullulanibacillus sp. KACC 23026]WEG11228.1 flagellar biosynthetic protein FliR [Pullulanibacillus sp. KACC 23026]
MTIDTSLWWPFLLIFVRISSFMISAPVFSGRQIPASFKIGFSVILSVLCAGVVKDSFDNLSIGLLVILILKEFMVGIVLGLIPSILLYSVELAGSLLDIQIGFSMANLFDPMFNTNTQLTGRLQNILTMLVFFATDAHHLLIQGILASFDWIALPSMVPAWSDGRLSTFILQCLSQMFMIGFMMAAPIIGTLFLVDLAIGIIARAVPQMNIFAVAPPLKIILNFVIYILVLPSFFYLVNILLENMFDSMSSILKIMGA